jgi:exopolysaccharide biosynthesis polyprenyl glycosylphosphotransferase
VTTQAGVFSGAAPRGARALPGPVAHAYPRRDYWHRRSLALSDSVGLLAAFVLAALVSDGSPRDVDVLWTLLALPLWIVLFTAYGLYSRELKRISHSAVDDLPWMFHALLVGMLLSWPYYRLVTGHGIRMSQLAVFAGLALAILPCLRVVVRRIARTAFGAERVALIGDAPTAAALARKMRSHPEYGLDPVGIVGTTDEDGRSELPLLGELGALDHLARKHRVDRVLFSTLGLDDDSELELMRRCRELGIRVSLIPRVFEAMGPSVEVDDVEGITVLGINPPVLSRSSRFLKRTLDLVGAGVAALALAPLMLLAALLIRATSKGPVFFRQKRIGRGGKPFNVVKFRTMHVDAEERLDELRAHSKDPNWLHLEHDPRITRVGRLLRMTSLDELPQLWNVLKGEMSLVGPRPLIESEDVLVDGWGRSRLALTPGITGFWQVLGRTNIPFDEMVKLDYLYVTNWSAWSDIRLILRTLPALVTQRGAN